jgi:hypothetical protein
VRTEVQQVPRAFLRQTRHIHHTMSLDKVANNGLTRAHVLRTALHDFLVPSRLGFTIEHAPVAWRRVHSPHPAHVIKDSVCPSVSTEQIRRMIIEGQAVSDPIKAILKCFDAHEKVFHAQSVSGDRDRGATISSLECRQSSRLLTVLPKPDTAATLSNTPVVGLSTSGGFPRG